ncbi:MAG: hypothetical protein IPP37_12635 [Saprospiraceae bacterium]|nr:hypothetical protein [Saprospiraceae bacterium]
MLNTLTLEEKVGQLLMPRGNMSGKPHDVEKLKMWVGIIKLGASYFLQPHLRYKPVYQ